MGEGIKINNMYHTISYNRCHHFSEPVLHNSNNVAVFMTCNEASIHDIVLLIPCYFYCTNNSALPEIDVQYRRLESNGKTDFHVVQIALFLKYRSTCLSMVSDTVKWSRMDPIPVSLVKWSNGVLLPKLRGRKASESNGSNRSNGVEWSNPCQMVKWCLVA